MFPLPNFYLAQNSMSSCKKTDGLQEETGQEQKSRRREQHNVRYYRRKSELGKRWPGNEMSCNLQCLTLSARLHWELPRRRVNLGKSSNSSGWFWRIEFIHRETQAESRLLRKWWNGEGEPVQRRWVPGCVFTQGTVSALSCSCEDRWQLLWPGASFKPQVTL